MLSTNIYIYSDNNNSWQLFGKNGTYKDELKNSDHSIYISHVNRNHYVVVTEVM